MELNWVTVAAQIINFLILVWLLNKFLYGPVTRAMEKRQARVRGQLEDAAAKADKAEDERAALKAEREALHAEREKLLSEARQEAEKLRHELEAQARAEIDKDRQGWRSRLERDREEYLNDLRRRSAEEFFALGRSVLQDLADARLETQIIAAFSEQLRALPEDAKGRLKAAVDSTSGKAQIETVFDLRPSDKKVIRQVVTESLGGELDLEYIQNDELVSGVRLRIGSQVVEWSIDSYLDALEDRVEAALDRESRPVDNKAVE